MSFFTFTSFYSFFLLTFVSFFLFFSSPIAFSSSPDAIRGVRPRDLSRYTTDSSSFRCFDGSMTIARVRVNDDYCDCPDGSDEPGTSACAAGSFYCSNKGSRSMILPSSRVDDGLCDCCDGSDERVTECPNRCEEEGKQMWENKLKDIQAQENGVKLKLEWIEEAKTQRAAKEADLAKFKVKLAERQAELEKAKAAKEHEENAENAENERRERERKAKEPVSPEVQRVFEELSKDIPAAELEIRRFEFLDEAREIVRKREEEAKTKAEEEATNKAVADQAAAAEAAPVAEAEKENFPYPAEYAAPPANSQETKEAEAEPEENFPYPAEYQYHADPDHTDEHLLKDDEHTDAASPSEPQQTATEDQSINEKYISESAQAAREEFEKWNKKVQKMQGKVDEIEKFLKLDFGTELQYTKFHNQCFSMDQKQYTYEICPFEEAKQKEGHSSTSLGRWSGFDTRDGDPIMKFTGGQSCWQGPQRSLTVIMKCDKENRVKSVDEPSKCVYEMEFGTPTVCSEAHIAALKMNLQAEMSGDEE